jgi:hypothetical protein
MKRNSISRTLRRTSIGALLLTAVSSAQAQQLAGGQVTINNKQVTRQGDKVQVVMDMNMDQLRLKSNSGLVLTPMLVNADDTLKMPSVEVMGHNRYVYYLRNNKSATANPQTVRRHINGVSQTVNYLYTTDFHKWMEHSQLLIAEGSCGCDQTLVADNDLTDGGRWLEPVKPAEPPKVKQVKTYNVTGVARLAFRVNNADINADMGNNRQELANIAKTISQVSNDSTMKITSILVHGYASPDGSYANNERLAKVRTEAIADYLVNVYHIDRSIITATSTAEDWQGVGDYVEKNDIPQKAIVQGILDSNLSPDEKERAIAAKAGDAHRFLIKKVYPVLRRTEYTVYYVYKKEVTP